MKRKTAVALIISAIILVIILAVWAFVLLDGNLFANVPTGAVTNEGPVAFYMNTEEYPFAETVANQKKYLETAAQNAQQNGFNTILFEANSFQSVMFKDNFFALATGKKGIDPLKYMSDYCRKSDISLYIVYDPYIVDSNSLIEGTNASSTVFLDGSDYILPSDTKYQTKIIKTVKNLAKRYSATGIILKTPNTTSDLEVWQTGYKRLLSTINFSGKREVGIMSNGYANCVFAPDAYKHLDDATPDIIFVNADGEASPLSAISTTFSASAVKAVPFITTYNASEIAGEIFNLKNTNAFTGVAFGKMPSDDAEKRDFAVILSAFSANSTPPPIFDAGIKGELSLNYPNDYEKVYSEQCFIMGYSNPNEPLYMDGNEIVRLTAKGSFGVLVTLEQGENVFTFTQGDKTIEFPIYRHSYSGGGGGGGGKIKHDGTSAATKGQGVQAKGWIISGLSDPDTDDAVSATIPKGATAIVTDCVKTRRNGKTTYAYLLESGDYVLASRVSFINETSKNIFTAATIAKDDGGEYLEFVGAGTPMTKGTFTKNKLELTFYNTDITLATPPTSDFFTACTATIGSNNETLLTLDFSDENPLWGYQIEYTPQGTTRLYLKKTPRLSDDPAKPLTGVRVMLDAGHGGDDSGALGISGGTAKTEKDFNLAVMLATKYRLEQMGATVLTTRNDDGNVSLDERSQMAFAEKPDFFLAIHHNSILLTKDANESHRVECYFFESTSQNFAQKLLDNVATATNRELQTAENAYFYVNRMTICPSVLFEYGFLVNPVEYELCADNATINATAFANAQSIIDTIGEY